MVWSQVTKRWEGLHWHTLTAVLRPGRVSGEANVSLRPRHVPIRRSSAEGIRVDGFAAAAASLPTAAVRKTSNATRLKLVFMMVLPHGSGGRNLQDRLSTRDCSELPLQPL